MLYRIIANILPSLPKKLVWQFSKKYIAGTDLYDAVWVSGQLNQQGMRVTIDQLGEFIKDKEQAREHKSSYIQMIKTMIREGIDSTFSVKPTYMGLLLDADFCYQQMKEIVDFAARHERFVRIDMEDFDCVDKELALFYKLNDEYPAYVGIVLQAYLRRTRDDLQNLVSRNKNDHPINIRLCKGIYSPPKSVAFTAYHDINRNFTVLLEEIIRQGLFPAIATHDKHLLQAATRLIKEYHLTPYQYEFQMLYGVTPNRRNKIVESGHDMRIYVPYGKDWFGYSLRRLKENPRMITHILTSLVAKK